MASHPEENDNLPETLSEEAKKAWAKWDLEFEKKLDDMSLLVSLSPKSKVELTSKSKSRKAADVTLTTAGLTDLDEMFQSIVDEKDGTTIAVPDNFPGPISRSADRRASIGIPEAFNPRPLVLNKASKPPN